jgi:hypothetical protein
VILLSIFFDNFVNFLCLFSEYLDKIIITLIFKEVFPLTFWHIVNIVAPLAIMVGVGFFIDRISKPEVPVEESKD